MGVIIRGLGLQFRDQEQLLDVSTTSWVNEW